MEFRRRYLLDLTGIIILLIILALLIAVTLIFFNTSERARGSIFNHGPEGVSQFVDWLEGAGFSTRTIQTSNGTPGAADDLYFILAPRGNFTSQQLFVLDVWVQNGGALFIAQESGQPGNLMSQFDARIRRSLFPIGASRLALPTFNWPPVSQVQLNTNHYVGASCGAVAVHIGDCSRPLLTSFGRGRGQVFILSSAYPFTNSGFQTSENKQLLENIVLGMTPADGRILFDEFHHELPWSWLITSVTGWALWLSILALLIFFFWHQSYLPVSRMSLKKRQVIQPVNPVYSLDVAHKHFAKPETIKNHYWQRIKRSLARRYGVDPAAENLKFVESLKPHLRDEDLGTLFYLINYKDRFPPMSESELRQWVSVAVNLTESHILTREIYEHQKTI